MLILTVILMDGDKYSCNGDKKIKRQLIQSYRASKWQVWNPNPGQSDSKGVFITAVL